MPQIHEINKIKHTKWLDAKTETGKLDGKLHTYIIYVTEDKKWYKVPAPFSPYFFITREDYVNRKRYILRKVAKYHGSIESDYYAVSIFGEPLLKITVPVPSFVRSKRKIKVKVEGTELKLEGYGLRLELEEKGISTYESDIPFYYRVMFDKGIFQCPIRYKLYSDIEVEALDEFPDPKKAKHRLLSIASVDEEGKEFFFSHKHETKIFRSFQQLIQEEKYHVVAGWNWEEFDRKYLVNRAKRKRLDFELFGIQEFDMMKNFSVFVQATHKLSLASVAEEYLSEDMQKLKVTPKELWESFLGDKKCLREYNMRDAMIVRAIDKEFDIVDRCSILAELAPIFFRDIHKKSALWQHIVLYNLKRQEELFGIRIVLPRREKIPGAELKGGYVKTPPSGIFKGVACADFTSLYPTIMMTFELDPIAVSLYLAWKASGLSLERWITHVFKK